MQVTATFSKALATAALCLTLAACSSGPSDSDVQAIADQGIAQMAQAMAPLGINLKEDFDIQVKIVNKTKQDDGRWLVQTQTSAVAKKIGRAARRATRCRARPLRTSSTCKRATKAGWPRSNQALPAPRLSSPRARRFLCLFPLAPTCVSTNSFASTSSPSTR